MTKTFITILLTAFLLISCSHTGSAVRQNVLGRPILKDGTVMTSYGTMLRGPRWSLDTSGQLPDRESVREIRKFGMNSLHVYVERHDSGVPAGSYVEQMDRLAQWCGEDGLYCVIVIGGGSHDGSFNLDFARTFWKTYAPRYRDMPWVIYEIHNEPDPKWMAPYEKETMAMEQEMYDLIRTHAPRTMVLLFTVGTPSAAKDVIHDVKALDVDWRNAAVAIHGFGRSNTDIIEPLKQAGIPVICTELGISSSFSDDQVNPRDILICEKHGISWLSFMPIEKGYLDSWRFKKELDKRHVGWTPDWGDWPRGPSHYIPAHNLALGKRTIVSSEENYMGTGTILKGAYATDGHDYTRWGSGFADNQYLIVDLEKPERFNLIVIWWDSQWAVDYDIQVSNDAETWKTIFTVNGYKGPSQPVYMKQRIRVNEKARYLKFSLKKRRMQWGFSIYEIEVFNRTAEEMEER